MSDDRSISTRLVKSMKPHIAPTLHNAIGGLIVAAVLFLISAFLLAFEKIRSAPVPFWVVLVILMACGAWIWILRIKEKQRNAIVVIEAQSNSRNFQAMANQIEALHSENAAQAKTIATQAREILRIEADASKEKQTSYKEKAELTKRLNEVSKRVPLKRATPLPSPGSVSRGPSEER